MNNTAKQLTESDIDEYLNICQTTIQKITDLKKKYNHEEKRSRTHGTGASGKARMGRKGN